MAQKSEQKSGYIIFAKKAEKYDFCGFRSKMSVSREKVRLVGQFEILAQDNFFSEQSPSSRTIFF